MAIQNIDLSGNTFTLTPMVMTDTAQQLLESIITNIAQDKTTFEQMSQKAQTKVNEVIGAVNAINSGLTVDLGELQQKIQAIVNLQSELGDNTFVGLFRTLFDELNSRKEILVWTLDVTSTVEGKVGIDLTQYGFSSINDYEVMCNIRTKGLKNLSATFEKVSATSGVVTIRSNDHISFATNANSFFTANATDNKVQLTLLLSKTATPIFGSITEIDGDLDEFGEPLIAPVVLVNSTVDASGMYTFNGLQGTLTGTVITMVDTDPNVSFTITAVDGTDAMSIVSNAVLKENGSITVYKAVNTVNAPSRTFNYVSPYPQPMVNMVAVANSGNVTFTGNVGMSGYTLKMTMDGTSVYTPIVLDANGVGTTTEFNTIAKDGTQHTIVFTVTSTSNLESVSKSKIFTIVADPNQSEI